MHHGHWPDVVTGRRVAPELAAAYNRSVANLSFKPFGERTIDNPTTGDVVDWMCRLAYADHLEKPIRTLAEKITSGIQSGDYNSEALAICDWVFKHIRYQKDPIGAEFVRSPSETLKAGCGDCDDMSVLIASLLMSIGHQCSFCIAAFTADQVPSHVFAVENTQFGGLALDPVANVETDKMLAECTAYIMVPVEQGSDGVAGLGQAFNGWGGYR